MANEEHLRILMQGVDVWNKWRKENRKIKPDLAGADLHAADLNEANLSEADLYEADLSSVMLRGANLTRADLRGVSLRRSNLTGATLNETNLGEADLSGAVLYAADLSGANLTSTLLIKTNFTNATLANCRIFGISAWGLILGNTIQTDMIITQEQEPIITVDNLEVAQFIYLLLNNNKIREVIDTITSKAVLILGRFTDERKAVLDAIREELRKRNYTPILFDFKKPSNRKLTETVITLAGMSRFVIADLSDPSSIPHEAMSFVEKLRTVPVQPIFCSVPGHEDPYSLFEDFSDLRHMLPIYRYETRENLITALYEKVIQPAEQKVIELRPNNPTT